MYEILKINRTVNSYLLCEDKVEKRILTETESCSLCMCCNVAVSQLFVLVAAPAVRVGVAELQKNEPACFFGSFILFPSRLNCTCFMMICTVKSHILLKEFGEQLFLFREDGG